jgi:DNA-binding transcriptional ArsR family regulator
MLALDLDAARAGGRVDDRRGQHDRQRDADPAAGVAAQAGELAGLVARCGGRVLADVSPSGGRHVFVLFAAALPWRELRDLARAIVLRFPAVDPAPMSSMGAQISPPGSRHKSGGWRLLSTPLSEARAAAEHPNGPGVWSALLTEFAAELQVSAARSAAAPNQASAGCLNAELNAELDDTGAPWIPRLGGRAPLGAGLDQTARTGRWDRSRYPDRSAARMAVLAAAAARGWQLADVRAAVGSGAWRGLARLYERSSEPGRLDRLLPYEWRKAVVFVGGEKNVRDWLTSVSTSRPPAATGGADEFGLIRQWVTGTACAVADPERVRRWGRRAVAVRQLLAAIGQAAMVSGSAVSEFGTRNLALHAGLSQRTVSRLLGMLYAEPDPLLDVVTRGRMARADRIALRIPDAYAESVRWRRRRAGRIDGIHPVFLLLGGTAGLVHQVLDGTEVRGAEVARAARLSPSATSAALRILAEHGLAERGRGGWRRGDASLDDVATSTGAADLHRERAERYKRDRESWQARLRTYQGARQPPVSARDGWWSLDDGDEYDEMCRWPVLSDDFVRGPPAGEAQESA